MSLWDGFGGGAELRGLVGPARGVVMGRAEEGSVPRIDYPDILAPLRAYPLILVTGPQRSGTHLAADVLAARLGRGQYIEEGEFRQSNRPMLRELIEKRGGEAVIQAPVLAHCLSTGQPRAEEPEMLLVRSMLCNRIAKGNGAVELSPPELELLERCIAACFCESVSVPVLGQLHASIAQKQQQESEKEEP